MNGDTLKSKSLLTMANTLLFFWILSFSSIYKPHHCITITKFPEFCRRFSFPEMASSGGPMPVLPTEKAVAHTSFWVGTNVMVLFPGWPGNYSLLHYYLALLLVFVLALLTPICGMCSMPANEQMAPMTLLLYAMRHGLRKCLFYLLVLSVVTFNVGVFLAAIAGHVIGYFALSTCMLYHHCTTTDTKV